MVSHDCRSFYFWDTNVRHFCTSRKRAFQRSHGNWASGRVTPLESPSTRRAAFSFPLLLEIPSIPPRSLYHRPLPLPSRIRNFLFFSMLPCPHHFLSPLQDSLFLFLDVSLSATHPRYFLLSRAAATDDCTDKRSVQELHSPGHPRLHPGGVRVCIKSNVQGRFFILPDSLTWHERRRPMILFGSS